MLWDWSCLLPTSFVHRTEGKKIVEAITLMRIERNLHKESQNKVQNFSLILKKTLPDKGLKNQPTGKKKNIERVEDLERRTIKLAVWRKIVLKLRVFKICQSDNNFWAKKLCAKSRGKNPRWHLLGPMMRSSPKSLPMVT